MTTTEEQIENAARQRAAIAGRLEADIEHMGDRIDKLERAVEGMRVDLNRHLIDQQPTVDRNIQRIDSDNKHQDERIAANTMQIKTLYGKLAAFRVESRKDTARLMASIWISFIGLLAAIGAHIAAAAWLKVF